MTIEKWAVGARVKLRAAEVEHDREFLGLVGRVSYDEATPAFYGEDLCDVRWEMPDGGSLRYVYRHDRLEAADAEKVNDSVLVPAAPAPKHESFPMICVCSTSAILEAEVCRREVLWQMKPSARIHGPTLPARCANAEERRALVDALLAAWERQCVDDPRGNLRLGQLIEGVARTANQDVWNTEDGTWWEMLGEKE